MQIWLSGYLAVNTQTRGFAGSEAKRAQLQERYLATIGILLPEPKAFLETRNTGGD
jgi:hypothetical protein